jgi:oxalate decarboxylase/phosphoglucose isomerase-like protein (cupin superfamily)
LNASSGSAAYRITANSTTPAAGAGDQLTITLVDAGGNTITSFSGDKTLTFSGLATADDGAHAKVTDKDGSAVSLGSSAAITFASGVSSSASGAAVLIAYKAEGPVALNVSDSSGYSSTSTGGAGESLTIANVNPVAGADTETRGTNLSLKILISGLLADATDANHDNISFTSVNTSSSGQGATLSANSTYVFYLPANNNNDSFTYNISDGHGGTTIGTVTVNVTPQPPGAASGSITVSGGVATVTFYGIPGMYYNVERTVSIEPPSWTPLLASPPLDAAPPIQAAADGTVRFKDNFSDLGVPPASPPASAYYRLVPAP